LFQEIFDVIVYYDYGKDQWGCVNGQTYKNNAYRTRKKECNRWKGIDGHLLCMANYLKPFFYPDTSG
jgi:hypothetical protein